jgi:hypothetical protein
MDGGWARPSDDDQTAPYRCPLDELGSATQDLQYADVFDDDLDAVADRLDTDACRVADFLRTSEPVAIKDGRRASL